jgi:PASTA domain
MKQHHLAPLLVLILMSILVGACTSTQEVSQVPGVSPSPAVTALPTLEPSLIPSPEEVKKTAVPDVTGRKMRRARNILENSGFFVIVRKKTSEELPGTVLAMSPKPGSKLEAGDLVRLTIAKATPAPKPAPEPADCHPSYEGACLNPNASDYDCAGGSGNGPEYSGFVTSWGRTYSVLTRMATDSDASD